MTYAVSTLSDALDRHGIRGQVQGLRRMAGRAQLFGAAWTVAMVGDACRTGSVGDYIDDVEPGSIVVIDNLGRLDVTVWGDLLTAMAVRRGIAGTVIDGVFRDADACADAFTIFARGSFMRTGKDRVRLAATQVPVTVGGVRVHPGDTIAGDGDGLVCIPRARAADVLATAARIHDVEQQIRSAIDAGMRLDEARRRFAYHRLQAEA